MHFLRGEHGITQEHGPRHWSDTANSWCNPASDVGHVISHIGHQFTTDPAHTRSDHGRTGLHHIRGHQTGHAGGRHNDVGLTSE